MKKLLSLCLALIMLCGSATGLASCGDDVIINDTNIETLSDTEKPTDDGNSLLPDDKDSADGEKDEKNDIGVTVAQLKQANEAYALLSKHGNILIKETSYGAADAVKEAKELFYSMDTDGRVTLDAVCFDENGEVDMRVNALDGAVYTKHGENIYFSIIPDADYDGATTKLMMSDPWENSQTARLEKADGRIAMKVTRSVSYDVDGSSSSFSRIYTYYFNEQSLLLEGYNCEYTENGEGTRRVEGAYTYGGEYERNTDAYKDISASDDARELIFVIFPESENEETRKYSVSANAEVSIENDTVGDSYSLYKNMGCTKKIEELWNYVTSFGEESFRIYVGVTCPKVSFKYTLTENDLTKFQQLADAFVSAALENSDEDVLKLCEERLDAKYDYIVWQMQVGRIKYSEDATAGKDAYITSADIYGRAYIILIEAYKSIYKSDAEYSKSIIFADWSNSDFEIFERDNETIVELENTNDELAADAYDIISAADDTWDTSAVDAIFAQMVINYNELARLEGYDDYYAYASAENYNRHYTQEELELFRKYIKEYISPLLPQVVQRYDELVSSSSEAQFNKFIEFMSTAYPDVQHDYVREYINSYSGSINEKMSAMLDDGLALFGTSDNSAATAFVNYSSYYGTPYAFFSADYQDMLTIIHEMGHFVSMYYYSMSSMPYDTAETHSQGNEWMFLAFIDGKFDPIVYELIVTYRLYTGLSTVVISAMVDEFEQAVYTASTPVTDFEALVRELIEEYCGWDFFCSISGYTPYEYVQLVTTQSPVYYLNYSTSEIASLSFYLMASENYANAQEVYRKLQEAATRGKPLSFTANEIGLLSPFEESTYVKIQETFGTTTASLMAA